MQTINPKNNINNSFVEVQGKVNLQFWLDNDLENRFKGKVIDIDLSVTITWGNILASAEKEVKKPRLSEIEQDTLY